MATQITRRLWLGDINVVQDRNFLITNKITNVLDLGTANNQFLAGICYWKINIGDLPNVNIATIFPFCNKIINESSCTLVHCTQGKSRGPTVVIAWLISQKILYNDALHFLQSKRPQIRPNSGFVKQLLLESSKYRS